jgi:hypothetical protein
MKVLIVAPWEKILRFKEASYHPVDEKGDTIDLTLNAINSTFAEYNYFKEQKNEVSLLIFLPSTLSYLLQDPPPDFPSLSEAIKSKVKEIVKGEYELYVLPGVGTFVNKNVVHEHKGGVGNYQFLFYLYLYKKMMEYSPNLVILDTSNVSDYEVPSSMTATKLAIDDYVSSTGKEVEYFQIASSPSYVDKAEIRISLISKYIQRNVNIHEYLTDELKLIKILDPNEKGVSATGKSDMYAIGKCLEYGFPLALLYILKETNTKNLVKSEDMEKTIINSIKISKSPELYTLDPSLEAHENAPYYFIGYHFIENYKKFAEEDEFSIHTINKISENMGRMQKIIIEREIQRINELVSIAKEGEEFSYDYLINLGNMRVIDWVKKPEISENTECEFDETNMILHAGFDRRLTVVHVKNGIYLSYRKECLENTINAIKNMDKQD